MKRSRISRVSLKGMGNGIDGSGSESYVWAPSATPRGKKPRVLQHFRIDGWSRVESSDCLQVRSGFQAYSKHFQEPDGRKAVYKHRLLPSYKLWQ